MRACRKYRADSLVHLPRRNCCDGAVRKFAKKTRTTRSSEADVMKVSAAKIFGDSRNEKMSLPMKALNQPQV